jgi:hypothetical protein
MHLCINANFVKITHRKIIFRDFFLINPNYFMQIFANDSFFFAKRREISYATNRQLLYKIRIIIKGIECQNMMRIIII